MALRGAQRFHHEALLDAGVRILGHPAMLHAKAFVRDREDVLVETCNLDAWSLKRFFEIDVLARSRALAAQFDERFLAPAEAASTPGRAALQRVGATRVGGVSQRSRRCSDGARRRWAHRRGRSRVAEEATTLEATKRAGARVRAPEVEAGPHDCFPRAGGAILRS